jgi:N-acetylglucosaminyldiphosphoundecaprenol N-acetyl-beta-D-mannosaminyltransferase
MIVNLASVEILGVRVGSISLDSLLDFIIAKLSQTDRCIITYVNIHALNLAYEITWFRKFLNSSDWVFCDGFGVAITAWLLSGKTIFRYTPPDWFAGLAQRCAKHGYTLYLLGSLPGIAEKVATKLVQQNPELKVVGCHDGYFDKDLNSSNNQLLVSQINKLHPDVLVIGFGMPMQEKWLADNWGDLNVKMALPIGAMFDYISGELPRAPRWMTDHGLEWLGRLLIEPRRLWKRYLIGIPLFFWRVLMQKIGLKHFPIDPQSPDESLNESVISRER